MTPEPSPSPTQLIIPSPGAATWDIVAQWVAIGILIACTVAVIFFVFNYLPKVKKIKPFYASIAAVAVLGGVFAFLLPVAFNSGFGKDDDGRVLRQLILYTTGGVLGVITLGETHRKNNQEKEKNENDHTRQVYAERRSRYTKAVEQLANENAAVRLGGIYTLVGLVDEWLADESLTEDKQKEEGQVIINNLCSYIRSPFPLAEKIDEYKAYKKLEELKKKESENLLKNVEQFELKALVERFTNSQDYKEPEDITADYVTFHEEQDVRRTIFVEMSKRSSTFTKNDKGEIIETVPGIWSDFDFDFSRAPIFYPLSSLTIEKGNFSSAKFYSNANFSWAAFTQNADFSWAAFTQTAHFSRAAFTQTADFYEAAFTQYADFIGATFTQTANFIGATFTQYADFSWATFTQYAEFSGAAFTQNANFYDAAFTQDANFYDAAFTQNVNFSRATFTQGADFREATFTQTADFYEAAFTQNADFSRATFTQDADFRETTFAQNADFSRATFTQNADFSRATFSSSSPKFVETSEVLGMTFRARAQFAALSKNQRAYNFAVHEDSQPILRGEAELDGVKHDIPVGTVLFDPTSWDEQKEIYTRVSTPAK